MSMSAPRFSQPTIKKEVQAIASAKISFGEKIQQLNKLILSKRISDKPIVWSASEPSLASWNIGCGALWVDINKPEGAISLRGIQNPDKFDVNNHDIRMQNCALILLFLRQIGIEAIALQEAPSHSNDILYRLLQDSEQSYFVNEEAKSSNIVTAFVGDVTPFNENTLEIKKICTRAGMRSSEIQIGVLEGGRLFVNVHLDYKTDDAGKQQRIGFIDRITQDKSAVVMGDANLTPQDLKHTKLETFGALGCNTVDVIGSVNVASYRHHAAATAKTEPVLSQPQPTSQPQPSNLVAVYKETKLSALNFNNHLPAQFHLNPAVTQAMQQGTRYYSAQDFQKNKAAAPAQLTQFSVVNKDSLVAAKSLAAKGSEPLVLNLANKYSIGGGVEEGSRAQEETLFRCTNYFEALYPFGKPEAGRMKYTSPIGEFGCYYTPHVQVFRDATKNYSYIPPFTVSCVALAGYDLGKLNILEPSLKPFIANENRLLDEFKKLTKEKIRLLLNVALKHGHSDLVLGALSCGAFKLRSDNDGRTARKVAEAYAEVLLEPPYQNRFKNVTFAVYDAKPPTTNYDTFNEVINRLLVKSVPAAPVPVSPAASAGIFQPAYRNSQAASSPDVSPTLYNQSASSVASSPQLQDKDFLEHHQTCRTSWRFDQLSQKNNKCVYFKNEEDAKQFALFLHINLGISSVTTQNIKSVSRDKSSGLYRVFLTESQWEYYKKSFLKVSHGADLKNDFQTIYNAITGYQAKQSQKQATLFDDPQVGLDRAVSYLLLFTNVADDKQRYFILAALLENSKTSKLKTAVRACLSAKDIEFLKEIQQNTPPKELKAIVDSINNYANMSMSNAKKDAMLEEVVAHCFKISPSLLSLQQNKARQRFTPQ